MSIIIFSIYVLQACLHLMTIVSSVCLLARAADNVNMISASNLLLDCLEGHADKQAEFVFLKSKIRRRRLAVVAELFAIVIIVIYNFLIYRVGDIVRDYLATV